MKFALIYAIEILAMGALAYWSVRDKRTGWTPLQALWIQGPALVGTICVTFFWQLHSTDENNNWEQFALLLAILAYVVYCEKSFTTDEGAVLGETERDERVKSSA